MIPTPDPVRPGQRSVWTFPRPAIAETFPGHVLIEHGGLTVADTLHLRSQDPVLYPSAANVKHQAITI